MGARAGYTLATGLAIGGGAALGVVSLLVSLLPEAAVAPILIFIGLEITAQAFLASPPRHARRGGARLHARGGARSCSSRAACSWPAWARPPRDLAGEAPTAWTASSSSATASS